MPVSRRLRIFCEAVWAGDYCAGDFDATDKMCDTHTKNLSRDIVRGDPSGLSLTEYRLWVGFIDCPVPFWGVRQIRDINAISNSKEMQPWDVGGDYSRPICRRIVEGYGVPRELFGTSKRRASVVLHRYLDFLTPASATGFTDWLKSQRGQWLRRGRLPPIASIALDRKLHVLTESSTDWSQSKPGLWRIAHRRSGRPTGLRRFIFPWAMDRCKERYLRPWKRLQP